ncbi:DNA-binding protein [Devosia sp. SD17-2]|uniref:helix-turn-helix transcriptional regulator n=1 Tax=Devosia sp. SD17-2 TaxID=2976459 RepID=UPI0023D7CFF6|nr:DNA-binding protein [Devosia sp. SD17-2]WEJ32002.1 DNA-binding protein [Devosia sp. SD17-2]
MMVMETQASRYLTAHQVRARFGGISDMTLWRWLQDPKLSFPKPMVVNRRRLFLEREIVAWEAERAAA